MKTFILIDQNNIVRCVASEECNLHKDKLYMDKHFIERDGTVGDEYDPLTKVWTKRPENYPKPSVAAIKEKLITERMTKIVRDMAEAELTAEGKI